MKLLIEINDYEKLKNMVETLMDDKHRKTKNILLCVTGLPFFVLLILIINAICYQKTNLIIIFSILTLIFLYCFLNILTDNGAYLVNIYNKIQEMQKSSDEQSCLQIESWKEWESCQQLLLRTLTVCIRKPEAKLCMKSTVLLPTVTA